MMKKHKSILIVTSLILLLTGVFYMGTLYVQHQAEGKVQAAGTGSDEIPEFEIAEGENEFSREFAGQLLKDMPNAPLLDENASLHWGNSSLENVLNDVNATTSKIRAKEVIVKVCEEAGIDVDTAKVRDLTEEQIMRIDMTVFEYSDHPKN